MLGGVVGQAGQSDGLHVLPVSLGQAAGDLFHTLAMFLEPGRQAADPAVNAVDNATGDFDGGHEVVTFV